VRGGRRVLDRSSLRSEKLPAHGPRPLLASVQPPSARCPLSVMNDEGVYFLQVSYYEVAIASPHYNNNNIIIALTMTNKSTTAGDVLLYVPNLIGYLRVICSVLSLTLMICFPQMWITAIILYVSSFIGDLFDGLAARKFDQCSLFGGLLDMVTDRCSTAGLLCALSHEHRERPILVLVRCTTYISVLYSGSKSFSKHSLILFFVYL